MERQGLLALYRLSRWSERNDSCSVDEEPNGEEKLLKRVVKGMLPKNRLGAQLLGNLYVYAGSEHKHEAQTPKSIDINSLK